MRSFWSLIGVLALAACAGYSGGGLVAGQHRYEDVTRVMGRPALEWTAADGARLLAYPRGPAGVHTFVVRLDAGGLLERIENVLAPLFFARIRPGMDMDAVLHTLGPPDASRTMYFKARDELVWEWRYCDEWNQLARFNVLFDAGVRTVRSTMSLREEQIGMCGGDLGGCWCAH